MFLNPASSSSIFNENTTTSSQSSSSSFHRSSSKNENAVPLGMKTPHNYVKHGSNLVKKSGQQQSTQRRRRALGDISNKNGGSAAKGNSGKNGTGSSNGIGGGGSLALKPLSLNNNQGGLRLNKPKNRQVKFSKSGSGIKSVSKQPLSSSSSSTKLQKTQSSSEEYDGIFGVTTRWSTTHQDHDRPSPLEQLPDKDEFDLSTRVAEEIRQHRLKERVRKEKVEEERMEERLRMKRDVLFDGDDEKNDDVEDGLQQLLTNHCNIVEEEEQEALWELKTSPAWEEEEEEFDPAKERRLSGNDPVSLWGDVLSP